ncbi:hypothetical protein SELMODRAFT_416961 [Selaginella moellendorffii]|uniref:Uncharacterized protein n=1 Tax=Selaginella moellendorffii TaxID=88036 RepID=D8S0Y0_SELML|nr:hypothetical protein SELMODRAFT_416961 [Selaginella moellendorffii]
MARKRRALAVKSSNARAGEEEEDAAAVEDDRVAELCQAIDLQGERLHSGGNLSILVSTVQARAAAIRAIRDAQIAEFLAQLQLQQASLSEEMLDMPICEFLERFCPNTELVCKESGVVEMRKKKLPTSDAGDPLASLFALSALKNTSAAAAAAAAATAKKSSASFFCTPRTLGGGISSSMKTRTLLSLCYVTQLLACPCSFPSFHRGREGGQISQSDVLLKLMCNKTIMAASTGYQWFDFLVHLTRIEPAPETDVLFLSTCHLGRHLALEPVIFIGKVLVLLAAAPMEIFLLGAARSSA